MNIYEVQLLTDDLDATRFFYSEVMALKIHSTHGSAIKYSAGNSLLTFHKSDNVHPQYHFAFNIPNNRFRQALDWAGSNLDVIEITSSDYIADFKSWNAKAFYFFDNNKNIVEMIARYDLDNASELPFHGSSVCSISEIGVVVQSPKEYVQKLLANYNLDFFSKQPPMDDFIGIGDDEGLFIVVAANRKWYPTDIRSSRHWARVTIGSKEGAFDITL